MSRSITLRLILSFLLVGIAVVALASGITYWLTVREFRQLTFEQSRDRFVSEVTFYYETHGSWDGVLEYYRQRSGPHGPFSQDGSPPPGPDGGRPQSERLLFGLADDSGRVLIPSGDLSAGRRLPEAAMVQGTPVTVNNARVGTVFAVGSLPQIGPL